MAKHLTGALQQIASRALLGRTKMLHPATPVGVVAQGATRVSLDNPRASPATAQTSHLPTELRAWRPRPHQPHQHQALLAQE